MRYRGPGEVPAENYDFWNETIFDAVIEHFSKANQGLWMVKPYIRKEEKVELWKFISHTS